MNPFDEIAVEEAVRLKEKGAATEIVAVSMGGPQCAETIRTALAMGADRGILVETDVELQPLAVAKVLKAIVDKEQPELIMGKQAIDDDMNATGQMLAALLGWPQGTFAVEDRDRRRKLTVTREVDGGLETIELTLPGHRHHRLAAQRASLCLAAQHHEGASKKPIENIEPADLGVDPAPRLKVLKVAEPPRRQAGVKVGSVAELVAKTANRSQGDLPGLSRPAGSPERGGSSSLRAAP